MPTIDLIEPSPVRNKRFRAVVVSDDGVVTRVDFGQRGGAETFLDHKDLKKKAAYWKRHYANESERKLIDTLTPSPSVLSAFLLWGPTSDLKTNVMKLNELWDSKGMH
jgi:hypothetical protein